ncbi:hypothetical protein QTH97_06445 [Variovorax sp. J22R24]|uniref:hypothetical protein n=1 Tax=Variovorax gracilis TaxID=3053502 RepID=UPI002575BB0C|nr:hypothetical protein [Variovorax sp. J22R24]MDM0104564.1 hypothetical protein [Variovorax sp. J22R24]
MSSSTLLVRRNRLVSLVLACAAPSAAVFAQNPQPPASTPTQAQPDPDKAAGRHNQKIERIHVEDRNATVDELRVGGQTESITVKPANGPSYQVMPNETERVRNQGQSDQSSGENGSRVWWNVFKF